MNRKERAEKKALRQTEQKWRESINEEKGKGCPGGGRYLSECKKRLKRAKEETLEMKLSCQNKAKETVRV